jgi:HTH-type transcriptional regulator/antitoxin HigA
MTAIKPIRSEADYDLALQEIDRCLDAPVGSPERDRLEVLTVLVDDYEAKHYPITLPDPVAAIDFVLEQRGLTRHDLEDVIGSNGRVSEIMNKRRSLSLNMIRKLVEKFAIPADVLIRDSDQSPLARQPLRVKSKGGAFKVTRVNGSKVQPAVEVTGPGQPRVGHRSAGRDAPT